MPSWGKKTTSGLIKPEGRQGGPRSRGVARRPLRSQAGAATYLFRPGQRRQGDSAPGPASVAVPGQKVTLLPASSSQRLRLRDRRSGGGERLGAGSSFPRAACCDLRRRKRPCSRRLPPPHNGQIYQPIERLAPPRCGCNDSSASGAGIVLEDPVAGALIGGGGEGGGVELSCGRFGC